MATTTPKAKRTTIKPKVVAKPSIEKTVSKKKPEKSALAVVGETPETKNFGDGEDTSKVSSKKRKAFKTKVIRDSFSFPEQDYVKISELKKTCLASGIHVKKNEILRAGLHLLTGLSLPELKQAIDRVEKIKTGRPKS